MLQEKLLKHTVTSQAVKDLAAKENVPVIDLTTLTTELYYALGVEGSKKRWYIIRQILFRDKTKTWLTIHISALTALFSCKVRDPGLIDNQIPLTKHLREEI